MIIGIDFDGTCVSGYPEFVDIGAAPVLIELQKRGHTLILNTLREGKELKQAEDWFEKHNIILTQGSYCNNKLYTHVFIDDRGFGCPSIMGIYGPCVDWVTVAAKLRMDVSIIKKVIKEQENVRAIPA